MVYFVKVDFLNKSHSWVLSSFCISHRSGKFHNDTRATSKLIHTWLIKCNAQKDGSKLRSYYSFHGPFCQKQDFQERSCSGSSGMAHTMGSNNFWRNYFLKFAVSRDIYLAHRIQQQILNHKIKFSWVLLVLSGYLYYFCCHIQFNCYTIQKNSGFIVSELVAG